MHPPSPSSRASVRPLLRDMAAAVGIVLALAACSDSKKPSAASASSSSGAHPAISSSSAAPASTASSTFSAPPDVTAHATTTSTTRPKRNPEPVVACTVFNTDTLSSATGHTWTAQRTGSDAGCQLSADNGDSFKINVEDTSGANDEVYQNSQQRCDAGTIEPQPVADGGYACLADGQATAEFLIRAPNRVVLLTPVRFADTSQSDVKNQLITIMNTYQPS